MVLLCTEILQAGSSAAIAALAFQHRDNQNAFFAEGVVKLVVLFTLINDRRTRSWAVLEGPHDALYQLKSCQLLHSCRNKLYTKSELKLVGVRWLTEV